MRKLSLFLSCCAVVFIAAKLDAGSITVTVAAPALGKTKTGTIQMFTGTTANAFDPATGKNKMVILTPVQITKTPAATVGNGFNAIQARDAVFNNLDAAVLKANNLAASSDPKNPTITFKAVTAPLAAGTAIGYQGVNAAQSGSFTVGKDDSSAALMRWTGLFDSTDEFSNPTEFTFRVVTNDGSLGGTFSASTFSNLQDSTIAQTIYNLLEPSASSIGVQLFMDGTTGIDINFNPGVTSNVAEFDFGTTSQDGTILAAMNYSIPEPGTLFLFGTGLTGLLTYHWFRRARKRGT
jgi:hypothetical protein